MFESWSECKFCGAPLDTGPIGAAVDPDDLVAPPGKALPEPGVDTPEWSPPGDGAPSIPEWSPSESFDLPHRDAPADADASPWERAWSQDPGSDPSPSTSGADPAGWGGAEAGATGWDVAAGPDQGWSTDPGEWGTSPADEDPFTPDTAPVAADDAADAGPLVPVEGGGTWAAGPAPSTTGAQQPEDGTIADAWGTTGLDPVDWYPEPGDADVGRGDPVAASPWGGDDAFVGSADDAPAAPPGWQTDDAGSSPESEDERFDPGAIFRDPDPPQPGGFGQDLEPVAGAGELAVHWEPAGPDAWDTPLEPEGKPKGQAVLSREARLLVMGIIVILAIIGVTKLWLDRDAGHPAEWAPNVQQVADWVAKHRKLTFDHKVPVQTMPPAEYDAMVAEAGRPDDDSIQQQLTDEVAMWRALGGVEGNPETRLDWVLAQRPDLGAFYDLDSGELRLRQGTPQDRLGPGLAGALSIALDDQRGDLDTLRDGGIAENPTFDVVDGTAAFMRTEYARTSDPEGGGAGELPQISEADGSGDDLEFLTVRPTLRSWLGSGLVRFVEAKDGVEAVNELVVDPPTSSQQVMFPLYHLSGRGALSVEPPTVPEGAEVLESGTLGAPTWYLLLAAHATDADGVTDALTFAQRWSGDQFVAYREADGRVCVADVLRGADEADARTLTTWLEAWRDTMPAGRIDVETRSGLDVSVTACDPGADADQAFGGYLASAAFTAIVRPQLAAGYYAAGVEVDNGPNPPIFTPEVAWCMGEKATSGSPTPVLWKLLTGTGADYERVTLAAGRECGSHLVNQLFADNDD